VAQGQDLTQGPSPQPVPFILQIFTFGVTSQSKPKPSFEYVCDKKLKTENQA
jgi:hypothetical protein